MRSMQAAGAGAHRRIVGIAIQGQVRVANNLD
jgi:hypothetical protein